MMAKWYRVTVEEFHLVEIETEADNADAAMDKIEAGEWDDHTFIMSDETQDRTVVSAEEMDEDQEQGE